MFTLLQLLFHCHHHYHYQSVNILHYEIPHSTFLLSHICSSHSMEEEKQRMQGEGAGELIVLRADLEVNNNKY